MINYSILNSFIFLIVLCSCSNKRDCDPDFQRYDVYLYRTPEQSFLFFKNGNQRPISYTADDNLSFLKKTDKIFSSFYGRSVGVEASVCGKIDRIDGPHTPYTRNLTIRQARIVQNVDLTDKIEDYERAVRATLNERPTG